MQQLLPMLHECTKVIMRRIVTWTLVNLCRGKPRPNFELVRPSIPYLELLARTSDNELLTDACWALSYLSDGPNEAILTVIESGVLKTLVSLLSNASTAVQIPALRTLSLEMTR
jgi:importin subunit alpha-6/7